MKLELKPQLAKLLGHSALTSLQLAGAAWVALLAARGFSMVEIGLAESVFHVASLLFEIPSGVFSDVFGRKRSLALGRLAGMASSLLMAFSNGLPGVCLAMVLCAFSYNFDSGAREALAYDSLKAHGREGEYLRYSSLDMAIYRVGRAGAVLLVGLALAMGQRLAYLLDAAVNLLCLLVVLALNEAVIDPVCREQKSAQRIASCVRETVRFLLTQAAARRLMLLNAFSGAAATLLAFFLQARLPLAGLEHAYLGPALFVMSLGGAVGSRLSLRFAGVRYSRLYALCLGGILAGLLMGTGHAPAVMVAGGFAANVFDDLLQVRTDSLLNAQFPSSQRSTLVSVASLCFSLVMIGMSPLAGVFFAMLP